MKRTYFWYGYWLLVIGLFAVTSCMAVMYAPMENTMGIVQKIFYLHLPVAINTFVAALIMFIAGVGYLWQRHSKWDDLGAAAGQVTVLFCTIVLATGMIWGKSAWGQWWTWSPRLTFSLVLWLLYVVYLMIRPAIESPQKRAVICAVYGVAAFLDVPLVYFSTKMMPDIHPASISLAPEMKYTLLAWFLPVTMLMAGFITMRYKLNRHSRDLSQIDSQEVSS